MNSKKITDDARIVRHLGKSRRKALSALVVLFVLCLVIVAPASASGNVFINVFSAPEEITQGTSADFVINAEASDNGIQYYIIGTNFFEYGAVPTADDGTTSQYTVGLSDVTTETMAEGKYFAVFQHPMYDGLFQIGADGSDIELNGDNIFNVAALQAAEAAQALCDALDAQTIDDLYVMYEFIVAGQGESVPVTVWEADTNWWDENPWDDEYTIYTANELAGLAYIANTQHQFNGQTVKLGADIDLENKEWTPIGIWDDSSDFPQFFGGVFDGQGHTISNLYISNESLSYVGLFGFASEATISNLTLVNVNVTGTNTDSEYGIDVGALVGFFDGGSAPEQTIITNCSVIGGTVSSISEMSRVGGLVGSTRYGPEISQCYAEVRVIGDSVVGGIVGNHNQAANMNYCTAKCTIITEGIAGGLVGYAADNSNIFASVADCDIQGHYDLGGIVGEFYGGNITDCFVNFNITTTGTLSQSGGIVGTAGYETTNITNCYSTGSIVVSNKYSIPYTEGNGGLIGSQSQYAQGAVNIINSVSLMQYVYGFESTGRLAGTENVNVVNSYAWEGMTNNGVLFSDGGINGTSVSSDLFWNNQSFFADVLGWDFTNTWKMNSGNANAQLPVLQFMQTPVAGDVSYLLESLSIPELKDTYIVGIDANYPPFTYLDSNGNPTGFDVESILWIAEQQGFDVIIQPTDWYSIIPALNAGQIDMIYSGMSITPEHAEQVTFSDPYYSYSNGEEFGVAMRKDDTALHAAINEGIAELKSSEKWDELVAKYFSEPETPSIELSIHVDKTPVLQGDTFNVSGDTNLPSGTNLTLVLYRGNIEEDPENIEFLDGVYILTQAGDSDLSTWSIPCDTSDLEPGEHFFLLWLTDDEDMYVGPVSFIVEERVPTLITISPYATTINATESVEFTVTVYDRRGEIIDDVPLLWGMNMPEGGSGCTLDEANHIFTASAESYGDISVMVYPQGYEEVNASATITIIPLQASSIKITGPSSALEVNDVFELSVDVRDQFGEPFNAYVEWWSDNESVGTIDKDGTFTAIGIGSVNVTAGVDLTGSGEYLYTICQIIVSAAVPAGITIEPATAVLNCSEKVSFTATVVDKHGNEIADVPVTWSVNTDKFGTIDENGNFIAVDSLIEEDGTVTVTVSPTGNPGITDTATVNVIGFHATEILLTPTSATLEVGDTTTLTAVVKDQFGNTLDVPVTWTSGTSNVGTVSEGVVTAVQKGTTTITASAGSISNYTEIIVIAAVPREISISPASATINATESVQLTLTVKDKFGNIIENAPVQWEIDREVGFVSADGIFTSDNTASGTVNITAHALGAENVNATAVVTIIPLHAETISLTSIPQTSLEVNETFQFGAEVRDQLGNLFDTTVAWESDNTSVGTIDENGNFTAVGIGSANITASVGQISITQQVTVVAPVPYEIVITPTTAVLNHTETVTLAVTIKDKRGDVIESGFTWAKDTEKYGTFDETTGIFTAGKLIEENGRVIITATPVANTTIHANATITVNGFFADVVTITNKTDGKEAPSVIELNPEQTYSFNATVKDQFGNDFSEGYVNLTWKSNKENVGTITNGVFTAKAVGETTITAKSGNTTDTILIKVFEEVKPEIDNVEIESDTTEEMTSGKTAVNITVENSEKTEVTIDTKENKTTIEDKETNVKLVISFSKMENTTSGDTQSIEGNITEIKAEYPKMNVTASENVSAPVTFEMNLGLKNLTTNLPTVKPVINETKKQQIHQKDDFKNHEVGAMVEVDSDINNDLKTAELVFYIPKEWAEKSKMKVLHIKENSVNSHSAFTIVDNGDGNWKITITVTGFSAYAVTKDTYVAPETPGSGGNGGGYTGGGSTGKPTTTPSEPVTPPTEEPSDDPSDVPGTDIPDIPPVEPTEPKSPAPVAGMILGALAAAAVLRRK